MKTIYIALVACFLSCSCGLDKSAESGAWLLGQAQAEIALPTDITFRQVTFSYYSGGFGDSVAFIRIKGNSRNVSSYASHCEKYFNRRVAKGQGTRTIQIEDGSGGAFLPEGLLFTGGTNVYTHEPGQSVEYFIWFDSDTNEVFSIYRIKS